MPLIGEIGDTREMFGEICVEWKIKDFFSLSIEDDSFYESPIFGFSNACWCLRIHPNGQSEKNSIGFLSVRLARRDSGLPKSVEVTFSIKGKDGEAAKTILECSNLTEGMAVGQSQFISRTTLQNQVTKLMPSNVLTIVCIVKNYDFHATEVSLFTRLWDVSCNLKTVLNDGKNTDFKIHLKDCELSCHKTILKNRCNYFAAMLGNDWVENTSGEVKFNHVEGDVFKKVLLYMYSGQIEGMSEDNVCKIYEIAHELQLKGLVELCREYIIDKMCLELFCRVFVIGDKYDDEQLTKKALDFFSRNARRVFASSEWKKFKEENFAVASVVLENDILVKMEMIKKLKM